MIKVNRFSVEQFRYDYTTSLFSINKNWLWVSDGSGQVNMFVDGHIQMGMDPNPQAFWGLPRYGWLLESKTIVPEIYDYINNNVELVLSFYENIFTHDRELAQKHDKFILIPTNNVPWIQDKQIYPKTKLVSMVSSNKTFSEGHRNRLNMIQKYVDEVDFFGRGFNPFEKKEDVLKDYMFSITVENFKYDNYSSEKLTDTFACGTVPIYYGSDWVIDNVFDPRGVIKLTDDFKVSDLSPELYYEMMPYIKNNFDIVSSIITSEDYIYEKYWKQKYD